MWPAILPTMGDRADRRDARKGRPLFDDPLPGFAIEFNHRSRTFWVRSQVVWQAVLEGTRWSARWRADRPLECGTMRCAAKAEETVRERRLKHRNAACLVGKGFPAFGKRAGPGPQISVLATSGRQSDHATSSSEL